MKVSIANNSAKDFKIEINNKDVSITGGYVDLSGIQIETAGDINVKGSFINLDPTTSLAVEGEGKISIMGCFE
jgi:hypothetical protein